MTEETILKVLIVNTLGGNTDFTETTKQIIEQHEAEMVLFNQFTFDKGYMWSREREIYINWDDTQPSLLPSDLLTLFKNRKKMKTALETAIDLLEDKHKHFIGVDGEESRKHFKNGLEWAIDTIKSQLPKERQDIVDAYNIAFGSESNGETYFTQTFESTLPTSPTINQPDKV